MPDLKLPLLCFAAAFAILGVDIGAQVTFLDCSDRAPAIEKLCR